MFKKSIDDLKMFIVKSTNLMMENNNDPKILSQIKNDYYELKSKVSASKLDSLNNDSKDIIRKFENTLNAGMGVEFKGRAFLFVKKYIDEMLEFAMQKKTQKEMFDFYEKLYGEYLYKKKHFIEDNPDIKDLSDFVLFEEQMLGILTRNDNPNKETATFEA